MSGSNKTSSTSNSNFRTRSAGSVHGSADLLNFRDEQSLEDTEHAKVRKSLRPDDIDEQIRLFFAGSPTQGTNARRRDR